MKSTNKKGKDKYPLQSLTSEEMNEYTEWKGTVPKKDDYIKKSIIKDLENLNTLVVEKKYDKTVWFNQYNIDVKNPTRKIRIIKLAKDLGLNELDLTNEDKAKIGFYLYCDYLKGLHSRIEEGKQLIKDSEVTYVCHWRKGEVLHLFGNPKTKQELEACYKKNREVLKQRRLKLEAAKAPTEEIEESHNAIKDLDELNEMLIDNWKKKVNPLDPSIDDRKMKDLPLDNSLLKSLAKEEESTTQRSLSPAE